MKSCLCCQNLRCVLCLMLILLDGNNVVHFSLQYVTFYKDWKKNKLVLSVSRYFILQPLVWKKMFLKEMASWLDNMFRFQIQHLLKRRKQPRFFISYGRMSACIWRYPLNFTETIILFIYLLFISTMITLLHWYMKHLTPISMPISIDKV